MTQIIRDKVNRMTYTELIKNYSNSAIHREELYIRVGTLLKRKIRKRKEPKVPGIHSKIWK